MDDWKLKATPVVRLKRSNDRFVYFIAGDSDPAAGPIASLTLNPELSKPTLIVTHALATPHLPAKANSASHPSGICK